jgi:hypothetical protein
MKRSAGAVLFPASIAVAFAGFGAAVLVAHAEPTTVHEQPTASSHSVTQPPVLSMQGTVVAVTSDSITARSSDGYTQTYKVTPNTTAVTGNGAQFTTAAPFAVNDQVAIQGTMAAGTVTATAVADSAVIGQNGRPMDTI